MYDKNTGDIAQFLSLIKGGKLSSRSCPRKILALNFNVDTNTDSDDGNENDETAGGNEKSITVTTPSKDNEISATSSMSRLIGSSTSTSTFLSFFDNVIFLDGQSVFGFFSSRYRHIFQLPQACPYLC